MMLSAISQRQLNLFLLLLLFSSLFTEKMVEIILYSKACKQQTKMNLTMQLYTHRKKVS